MLDCCRMPTAAAARALLDSTSGTFDAAQQPVIVDEEGEGGDDTPVVLIATISTAAGALFLGLCILVVFRKTICACGKRRRENSCLLYTSPSPRD